MREKGRFCISQHYLISFDTCLIIVWKADFVIIIDASTIIIIAIECVCGLFVDDSQMLKTISPFPITDAAYIESQSADQPFFICTIQEFRRVRTTIFFPFFFFVFLSTRIK